MAKKSLKEHMAGAEVANYINDIMIDKSIDRLENAELTEKEKAEELSLLKRGLETRSKFAEAKANYRAIKAEKKGYIIGWASATVGAVIGVLAPRAIEHIKTLKKN